MGGLKLNMVKIALIVPLGFASGVLTALASDYPMLAGGIFGLALSAYCWQFLRIGSAWRMSAFVGACTIAHAAAVASFWLPVSIPHLDFSGERFGIVPTDRFALCGAIGASIIFTAAVLLLSSIRRFRILILLVAAGSFLGAALGLAGWMLGPSLGQAVLSSLRLGRLGLEPSEVSLYVLWQAGMALALAFVWGAKPLSFEPVP